MFYCFQLFDSFVIILSLNSNILYNYTKILFVYPILCFGYFWFFLTVYTFCYNLRSTHISPGLPGIRVISIILFYLPILSPLGVFRDHCRHGAVLSFMNVFWTLSRRTCLRVLLRCQSSQKHVHGVLFYHRFSYKQIMHHEHSYSWAPFCVDIHVFKLFN
jgi:hypothetical protein